MNEAHRRVTIEPLRPEHEGQWRNLWGRYVGFYQADVAEAVTARTWQRILDNSDVAGIGAISADALVGFAIIVFHQATWSIGQTGYLEDLFVREDERGRGAGRSLIDAVIRRARAEGCASLYWHTQAGNRAARRLYDTYALADGFVRYRLAL